MAKIQPVILSGGAGSRLWPASRSMLPKQLLPLLGEETMLQETVSRLAGLGNVTERPIVVCNDAHRFLVGQQLQVIGRTADVIVEPAGRNTAPAIALAAFWMQRNSQGDDVMLVLPADHAIGDPAALHDAVEVAAAAAVEGSLVTFGIVPTEAHTGYGYIEADARSGAAAPVESFVEKPDSETAARYVAGERHFWNSGMFVFRPDAFLSELQRHAPEIHDACRRAIESSDVDTDFVRPDTESFLCCPADSVDYAVMEKSSNAKVVPMDAGWSDIGNWAALREYADKDPDGNVVAGDTVLHDCKDSYISSESRLVAAVGIDKLVVVETKDSVLVAPTGRSQDVKALVDKLNASNREETSLHRQVFRPWGSYDSIDSGDGFQVKRLIVNPGAVLSLQMHHRRAEHWTVVRGVATITLNDDEFELGVDESTYIPIGARHRIANYSDAPVHIIEVQCGDYLGEDDIVRFEDNYGREGRTD